ncbi:MAG TPA: hypothetical protein VFL57_01635 [Bryobacteraceae bacterium]|nr:hypothetical protein [Bryobacteraceae bacterium]
MKYLLVLSAAIGLVAAHANAQPRVNAVLNAASYGLPGMPNEGVAQGSIATAFGTGLGTTGLKQVSALPLTTTWEGISVRITGGGQSVNAWPIQQYNGTQVSFVVPSNTPVGDGTVTVTFSGQTSAPAPIKVVARNVGVFSINSAGSGPGVFTDPLAGDVPNLLTRSSRPRQLMDIWATGLGAVSGNEAATPLPGDMTVSVEVWVGGRQAEVVYRGRSGCCVGVDQIRFRVPEGVSGCYVPVSVVAGGTVSNFTSMSIAADGGTCSEPIGVSSDLINTIASGGVLRVGNINLSRSASKFSFPGQTFDSTTDSGSASFFRYDFGRLIRSSTALGIPNFGSCSVSTFQGQTPSSLDIAQPEPLDAGDVINVNGPKGAKQLRKTQSLPGFYSAQLGGGTQIPGAPPPEPLYLDPGPYTFTSGGGTQVGPINTGMNLTALTEWTNMASIETVTRANGQLITWSGGDPNSLVYIGGTSFTGTSAQNIVGASFVCYERASAGRFMIPASVLLALPRSGTGVLALPGALTVGSYTNPATFTASGLDIGVVTAGATTSKSVTFQ